MKRLSEETHMKHSCKHSFSKHLESCVCAIYHLLHQDLMLQQRTIIMEISFLGVGGGKESHKKSKGKEKVC